MLYILETDKPPSTIVLLSFATSLIYLGCVSLVICCASSELAMSRGPSAEFARHVTFCGGHRNGGAGLRSRRTCGICPCCFKRRSSCEKSGPGLSPISNEIHRLVSPTRRKAASRTGPTGAVLIGSVARRSLFAVTADLRPLFVDQSVHSPWHAMAPLLVLCTAPCGGFVQHC
jgi:hypothetical protein